MAPVNEVPLHQIDNTEEYQAFIQRVKDYHQARGTHFDPNPKIGPINLDLLKIFNHVVANGGYDKISEEKLAWRRMCHELGIFSNNEASTAFALKEKFYKYLAAYEISTVHGREPPPKEILEDVTAKGAGLLTRTLENFKGKRESTIGAADSAASGDDGTPAREKAPLDAEGSARATRGLRQAPAQRVIFQPDTGPTRTRATSAQHLQNQTNSPSMGHHGASHISGMPPQNLHGQRGPSILQHAPNSENNSHQVTTYHPRQLKPLPLRAVATPSNAPNEFHKSRQQQRQIAQAAAGPMLPGTGFDGPNIYTRCLNALRSSIPSEQAFALYHLVKISYERGDKYRFDSFPGLAEGLVEKALSIGSMFYHVNWTITWDFYDNSTDIGVLDGNNGTADILERIDSLIEKEVPDALQTEKYADDLVLVTEAVLTIRNMMTLPDNAANMADFFPLKDLICIIARLPPRDSLIELKHMALDIAEQLTPFFELDSEDPLYKTLIAQLTSDDRGTILTALRALGRISVNLEATNTLGDVPPVVLQRIASWLLLNDDELTDACLDFLYQYTAVVPNVDNLITSTSPSALVDQLIRLLAHGARKVTKEYTIVPERKIPGHDAIATMPEDLLQEMIKLEEPDRVHKWVRCFFEEDSESFVTQLAAWQAYQAAFVAPLKAINQQLITPADFIRNSTSVYKDSNAQVRQEPGDPQQKFIINGLRARPRPLSLDGAEYGRCMWTKDSASREQCGKLYIQAENMWNHIMSEHLELQRNEAGQFDNVEKEWQCRWGECRKFASPTKMHLQDFARHVNTHITSMLPTEAVPKREHKSWIVPAKTMGVSFEETLTMRDERNPNLPPQAAGIPLSAALVLRNIARNVVKTDAEEELKSQSKRGEIGGWNERLFRPAMPRLFEILAENRALVSLLPQGMRKGSK